MTQFLTTALMPDSGLRFCIQELLTRALTSYGRALASMRQQGDQVSEAVGSKGGTGVSEGLGTLRHLN